MCALATEHRTQLARVILQARREAEAGARKALEALAVDKAKPFDAMTEEERALRRRLRAHGRQLGDRLDRNTGEQQIDHLAHEVAYEHWHRMLFARFLAENHLLIEPESRVAISMQDCEDLARELNEDPWALAGRYAARMLPRIFRPDDPALAVTLAPETRQALEKLLESLPTEVFTADDALGWTYQFWQAEKKEEVNRSGEKIGADELPAVTQLFTEHYMVQFLFHNTLGAWHAGKVLAQQPELVENAADEDALRRAVCLTTAGGYDFDYLRFVQHPHSPHPRPLSQRERGEDNPHPLKEGGRRPGEGHVPATILDNARKLSQRERGEDNPPPLGEGGRRPGEGGRPGEGRIPATILDHARELRKNQTDAEQLLWNLLRNRRFAGLKFRRQHPVGRYILDFYCHELKLAIELDGGQHNEVAARQYDDERARFLKEQGIRVLRFWNNDVLQQTDSVLEVLWNALTPEPLPPLTPDPSPRGRGEKTTLSLGERVAEGRVRGLWRPAAGAFEGWPDTAAELKVLDPCCGSGHFLVEGLHILARLRMEEEGLELIDAIRAVLADNLFGLEIDPRCTQIAAFSLALAAWKLIGKPVELPALNIACSGLPVAASKDEWRRLAGGDDQLERAMEQLHELFRKAPELGSLIDPAALGGDLIQAEFGAVRELLGRVLEREDDIDAHERAVAAAGMARAAELLADRYTLVITNVPYLARGKQSETLRRFADDHHPAAKQDLATLFLSRSLRWLGDYGTTALVTPQNWLFLTSYKKLREKLLDERTWNLVARLGPRAFETIGGEVVNVALEVISADKAEPNWKMAGVDVMDCKTPQEKAALLRGEGVDAEGMDGVVRLVAQEEQLKNPDAIITLEKLSKTKLLKEYVDYSNGFQSGDSNRFCICFWEIHGVSSCWDLHQTTVNKNILYGGLSELFKWENGKGDYWEYITARLGSSGQRAWARGTEFWGKDGVAISSTGTITVALYLGAIWNDSTIVLQPKNKEYLLALWSYCRNNQFQRDVRKVDQKLNVRSALTKVPFEVAHWKKVADEEYPEGLPDPQSNDPTQWLFHGHPAGMVAAGPAARSPWGIADPVGAERHPSLICREPNLKDVLQVAVARLLGYRWPAENTLTRPSATLSQRERVTPPSPLGRGAGGEGAEGEGNMRLDEAARAWVERCKDLDEFADEDGIVALSPLRGERSAADRLRALLAAAFDLPSPSGRGAGGEGNRVWNPARERELLQAAAGDGKPAASLEDWLRDRFFEEHCKLFHHRPFIWHIWDGNKDGFHVLVNYHRLAGPHGEARRTLEAIAYSYLGEWIERQKREQKEGREGADARLAAAQDLQAQLDKILKGEPPHDIFVRWKPLHEQPIGWEPDINDGVRLNIRPFMTAELRKGGRRGASILRWKPNLKWNKDRGKEPQSLRPKEDFPWFWSCPGDGSLEERTNFMGNNAFDGNRWNNLHYTNAVKLVAKAKRERAR